MGVKNLTPTKLWPTVLVAAVNSIQFNCKRKTTQFRMILVWIIIFYFKKIYLTMHLKTNGSKHFSKTNSSDPRQRVPFRNAQLS